VEKFIAKTPIGVFILDIGGRIIDHKKFPKDAEAVAKRLAGVCEEEKALQAKHKAKKYPYRPELEELAISSGFCRPDELRSWLLEVNRDVAKLKVGEELAGKDKIVIQAVRAQQMAEDASNKFSELLHEWYSIHFPELTGILQENEDYARFVEKIGDKAEAGESQLKKIFKEGRFVKGIPKIAPSSIGADFDKEDLKAVRSWASAMNALASENEQLKAYIEKLMEELAPNVAIVATPIIGAKLIDEAGSLRALALLPASTIQVLGAQKAMFRFLKTKKKPPKYGVLYSHPLVAGASRDNKGRIARSVANKISIAARVDFAGADAKGKIGGKLFRELEERAKSLKK